MKNNVARWLSLGMKLVSSSGIERIRSGRQRRQNRLFVEILERRQVLSTITWAPSSGGNWDTATNWSPAQVPGVNDDAVINLTTAGSVSLTSSLAESVHSIATNSKTTLSISTGSLAIGAGTSTLGGPVVVASGAQLSAVAGAAITLSTTQTLSDNGTVQFSAGDTVSLPGGSGPAQILVNAGGNLTATNTTFTGFGSSNITVNTNGTITPTGSTFGVPIFVPYNDVSALTNNHSFGQINIDNATLSSELDLNAIGIDTSGLSFNFPKGFTVQSGGSIVVGPGVTVQLPTTQTLAIGGTVTFNHNDTVSMPGGSGPDQMLVTAGGNLTATNTTFTGFGGSNITVNTNGTITPTGSTFGVPIFVPYNDVSALTNNYSFGQININNATLSSELDLNAIGTDTSSLSFNFPKGFTVQSGGSIVVGPGVTVQLPTTQTLAVGGTVTFNHNDTVSMPGGSGPDQILVTAGGNLTATNTTFTGFGGSNITVNTNGTITPTGSTFQVPIFVPYGDVSALTNNYSFAQININNATLSTELDLNSIGTDTSNLSYNFPKGFTVQSGGSIVVGTGVTVNLPTTQTLTVGGTITFNNNDTVSMPGGSGPAQILISASGNLTATNTTFTGYGGSNITANTNGTINPTGSTFGVPIFVPYSDVSALTNNYSLAQININNATLSTELDLNSIGTDTSNLSYNFPKGFTVQSGGSIVVGPGVTVNLPTTQTLTVGGTITFNNNDTVSMPGGSGPAQILISASGNLTATNTTFTGYGGSNITANTNGTMTPTGSTFGVPIFVPYNDVPALTNNYSFDQININNATLSSGELDLDAIGTDTSNLSFNFPKGFTVLSGGSIVVGPGVSVQLPTTQTLAVGGNLEFQTNDAVSLPGGSGPASIAVNSGGTLTAIGAAFSGFGGSNITINSGGTLLVTNTSDALPSVVLNAGSTDTMSAVAVSGKLTINSGATIDIAGNDFTSVPSNGIIAVGSPSATIDLEYNYWGTSSQSQIQSQILDDPPDSTRPMVDFSNFLSATNPYRFVVAGYPAATAAGASQNFTVTVLNFSGAVVTTYTGTIHFTSTDLQSSSGAGLPANYTFTTGSGETMARIRLPPHSRLRVHKRSSLKTRPPRSSALSPASS